MNYVLQKTKKRISLWTEIMKKHADPSGKKECSLQSPEHFFREIQIEFLAHELKDPLSVIETGTRALLEKREKTGPLSPRQEKTLKRILRSTKKARGMLNDLLEIGRSEAGSLNCCRFEPAKAAYEVLLDAMETMIGNYSEPFQEEGAEMESLNFLSRQGIFLEIPPQMAHAEMLQDETKFRQIVGNLIKNALHHRKERVEIKLKEEKNRLFIEVTDDGPGIEPAHHQMIFQRYTQINECSTLARKGHGLGLAGALILARCLGGDIELESKKGKGATFRLILPITLEKGSHPQERLAHNKKILDKGI